MLKREWKLSILLYAFGPSALFCPFLQGQAASQPASGIVDAIRLGAYPEAVKLCQAELQQHPRNYQIWTLKGVALARSQQEEQALVAYDEALKLSPDYLPALEGAAEIEYQRGDEHAIAVLQHLIAVRPEDPTAHAMLGVAEYKRKNCAAAVESFQASGGALHTQAAALTEYGICLAKLERYQEAVPLFEEVLALQPEVRQARYNLALSQWMAKQGKQAIRTLQPLLEQQSADEKSLGLAASINESENDTPRAVELLRKAILQDPRDLGNYLDFATLSYAHGSYSVGIDVLTAGLTRLPNSAQLYMARGVLYGQMAQYEKASADFEKANAIDPKISATFTAKGIAQAQQHNLDAAIQSFRAEIREHPQDAIGYYLLAESLSEKESAVDSPQFAEAIRVASRAVELNPKLAEARDLLSTLYLRSGQTDLVIEQCRAVLQEDPKNQQALYHLILALRRSGKKDEIADLVKQLTALRQASDAENSQKTRYALVEVP